MRPTALLTSSRTKRLSPVQVLAGARECLRLKGSLVLLPVLHSCCPLASSMTTPVPSSAQPGRATPGSGHLGWPPSCLFSALVTSAKPLRR